GRGRDPRERRADLGPAAPGLAALRPGRTARARPVLTATSSSKPQGVTMSRSEHPAKPSVTDRDSFQAELDRLRVREKAHTREGDAIGAARRRLPMVEVDAGLELIGPDGPLTLLDTFEGRRQLIAYYFMWHPARPAAEQCEGCTFYT